MKTKKQSCFLWYFTIKRYIFAQCWIQNWKQRKKEHERRKDFLPDSPVQGIPRFAFWNVTGGRTGLFRRNTFYLGPRRRMPAQRPWLPRLFPSLDNSADGCLRNRQGEYDYPWRGVGTLSLIHYYLSFTSILHSVPTFWSACPNCCPVDLPFQTLGWYRLPALDLQRRN